MARRAVPLAPWSRPCTTSKMLNTTTKTRASLCFPISVYAQKAAIVLNSVFLRSWATMYVTASQYTLRHSTSTRQKNSLEWKVRPDNTASQLYLTRIGRINAAVMFARGPRNKDPHSQGHPGAQAPNWHCRSGWLRRRGQPCAIPHVTHIPHVAPDHLPHRYQEEEWRRQDRQAEDEEKPHRRAPQWERRGPGWAPAVANRAC